MLLFADNRSAWTIPSSRDCSRPAHRVRSSSSKTCEWMINALKGAELTFSDCVMPIKRSAPEPSSEADEPSAHLETASGRRVKVKNPFHSSSVTLSGLLNAIDGVASQASPACRHLISLTLQEDSVLFASTNFPDNLDEALRRPGRFDVDVPFTFATHEQAVSIFKHFYAKPDTPAEPGPTKNIGDEKFRLDDAAVSFADAIMKKGIEVSIATIQGYLLLYKRDPIKAQEKAGEWAEGIRVKQAASPTSSTNGVMAF
jgi:hypothetical protein